MDNRFDYKIFASKLAFQVRPVVSPEYKQKEKDIQNIVYDESLYWGKKLSELDEFDIATSQYIIQIIAEWTFHKYIDMLAIALSETINADVIRKINFDLYNFLITHMKEPAFDYNLLLEQAEKIVKESYKKNIKQLKSEQKISEKDNLLISSTNLDKLIKEMENKNLCSVPISIFDILKAQVLWSLSYIISLPIFLLGSLILLYKFQTVKGIIFLIIFCLLLFRFITKEVPISINIPDNELSEN